MSMRGSRLQLSECIDWRDQTYRLAGCFSSHSSSCFRPTSAGGIGLECLGFAKKLALLQTAWGLVGRSPCQKVGHELIPPVTKATICDAQLHFELEDPLGFGQGPVSGGGFPPTRCLLNDKNYFSFIKPYFCFA